MLREFASFGSASAVEQVARLIGNLAAAAVLGPLAWGTWFLYNLVLQYGGLLHLGALNGMSREIPAALGREDASAALQHRRTALGFLLTAYALGLVVVAAVLVPTGVVAIGQDLWLLALLLLGQQLSAFALLELKARARFRTTARLLFASAVLYPFAVVAGAVVVGLPGFLAGQIVWYAGICLAAARLTDGLFAPAFRRRDAWRLVQIGFPIMAGGVVYALFMTVDRWVIQVNLGTEALGLYSLASMALGAVGLLPQVVAQQVFPRMAAAWARHATPDAIVPMIVRQRRLALLVTIPVALGLALAGPPIVRFLLPEFAAGTGAIVIIAAAPIVFVLGSPYVNVVNVVGRQVWYLLATTIGIAANVAVSLGLVASLGLNGVALGTLAGYLALSTTLWVAGRRVIAAYRTGG